MLIAFWSPVRGVGRITSTMLSSSLIMGLDNNQIQLLISGIQGEDNSIVSALSANLPATSTKENISSIEMQVSAKRLKGDILKDNATAILNDRLDLLDTSSAASKDSMKRSFPVIMDVAVTAYTGYFVDIGSGEFRELEREVINRATTIVVCLPQDPRILDKEIPKIKETLGDKKVIYCFTSYEKDAAFSVSKAISRYRLPSKLVFPIPRSVGLMNAMGSGGLVGYVSRIYGVKKKLLTPDADLDFLSAVRNLNKRILILSGLSREDVSDA